MRERPFRQVDVFTDTPYLGNPVAVVLDGKGLAEEEMQRLARWTNLSETTFVVPPATPEADYGLRIFTPDRELPFAGHPTLGSCHAWLQAGGTPKRAGAAVQECAAGLITIKHDDFGLAFAAPKLLRTGPADEETLARICRGLGIARQQVIHHQWVDNGPGWVAVMLPSAAEVLAISPEYAALLGLDVGVVAQYPAGSECLFEVRAFVSVGAASGYEDPVTGSLNAGLGQWLTGAGLAPEQYLVSQGTALHRVGRVQLRRDGDGQVWVGGKAVTCISGSVMV